MMKHRKFIIFISAGCICAVVYQFLTYQSRTAPSLPNFIMLYTLGFFLFLLSAYIVCKKPLCDKRSTLITIAVFAVSFRIISLSGEPLFDDDMHRYLWDGKVWSSGINPYFYPPSDFQLEHLQDENWKKVNFKHIPTIYPPLAQIIYRTSWELAQGSMIFLKGILLLFDLGILLLIAIILGLLNKPKSLFILYAWNPLVIKEFANSGHIDVVAIFFVMLFCLLSLKGLRSLSAIALGLAILTKLYPLVLLPTLIRYFKIKHFAIIGFVILLGYLPFREAEELVFEGLFTYARFWEFNDSGYVLISSILKLFSSSYHAITKGGIIIGLLIFGLWQSRASAQDDLSRLKAFFIIIGSLLVFSPTVDPWYFIWIIPFICIFPNMGWLVLSGSSVMAYCYYWQNRDFWWIRTVEYAPFYILLIGSMLPFERSKYFKIFRFLNPVKLYNYRGGFSEDNALSKTKRSS